MAEIFQTHYALEGDAQTRGHRFTRWVGGSIILHALLLAALVYIPAVRDTFALANQLSGFRVVSRDYKKTEVYERAVMLNLAAQQLYYPSGYFGEVASQTAVPSPDDPKFIATVNPTPEPTPKPVKPKPTPTPSPEASPAPQSAGEAVQGEKVKDAGAAAAASPAEPKSEQDAEKLIKDANQEKFPEINTKPFEDLLADGKRMKDAGQIDLTRTIEMSVEADRQDDGKLANIEVKSATQTDPELHRLAKDFISAVGDSQLLKVLDGTRHLLMKVRLDDKQVSVRVTTEMESADLASKKTNAYNGMLWIGAMSKKGKDEEALFKSVKINNEAKQVVLTFQMPRADAGALLSKITEKNKATPPGE
jgi:outer membrane biosynthesis protein TonB